MWNAIWTIINIKTQYEIQKNARGGGIIGLFLFFFILITWKDWFYPFFDAIGFVDIARNAGLIQETSVGTFFAVAAVLFVLLVITTLIVYSGTIITSLFLALPTPIQIILFFPILIMGALLVTFIDMFKKPSAKKKVTKNRSQTSYYGREYISEDDYFEHLGDEKEREMYNSLKNHPTPYLRGEMYFYQHMRKREDKAKYGLSYEMKALSYDEAYQRLNSVVSSFNSPQNHVVAYSKSKGWFLLAPQPLPAYLSRVVDIKGNYKMMDVKVALDFKNLDERLYVPAQPIYFYWNNDSKIFKMYSATVFSNQSIPKECISITHRSPEMMSLNSFSKFYYINEGVFPSLYSSYERKGSNLIRMREALQGLHELTYLIPVYFEKEWDKKAKGERNFLDQTKRVANYDIFGLVYMTSVEEKLKQLVREGDLQAFEAYRRMESNLNNKY